MKDNIWRNDEEYMSYVGSLLETKEVQKLANYTQHHFSTRLEHVITVSYVSYRIAKTLGWNAKAVARAGLLHDLFYYDWRTTKFDRGTHAWCRLRGADIHPAVDLHRVRRNDLGVQLLRKCDRQSGLAAGGRAADTDQAVFHSILLIG